MFRPTVIILGAGAAVDIGFPLGETLVDRIRQGTANEDGDLAKTLRRAGFNSGLVERFGEAIDRAEVASIDEFLTFNKEYRDVGKAAIVASLVPCEDETKLFKPKSLYRKLFRLFSDPQRGFDASGVAIITFNYDRALEHFFAESIRNTFGEANLAERMKTLRVFHVHGTLGGTYDDPHRRPFSPGIGADDVKTIAKSLRIVYEDNGASQLIQAAELLLNALWSAEEVIFLGFGFHDFNTRYLGIHKQPMLPTLCAAKHGAVRFLASRFGILDGDLTRLTASLRVPISFGTAGQTALEYLETTSCLIAAGS